MSKAIFFEATTTERNARKWKPHVYIWDTDLSQEFVGDGATLGGKPVTGQSLSEQAAVADVDDSALPANGTIGSLTFTAAPTGAECEALRDECENLRDALAASNATIQAILARLRSGDVIATS